MPAAAADSSSTGCTSSSQDERLRTLGLRLLDRESFEARASIVSAHADGHLTSDELAAIVRENDQASTAHRLEANSARLELARRRHRPGQ